MLEAAKVKVVYITKVKAADRPKIENSADAANIFRAHWDTDTIELFESAYVMLLSRSNRVLGVELIGTGGAGSCVVDTARVFQSAILANAGAIILAHNHPSGSSAPSEHDRILTKRLVEAGKLLRISVLDHLILTPYDGHFSFADDGLI